MSAATPLIQARELSRHFGALRAVDGIDLEAAPGEVLGLLGLNGAGKTTTLRMLCGVLAPTTGSIRINGIDLLAEPRQAKRHIGYLPETPPLYADMRVREYLHHCAALHGVARRARARATATAMAECGIDAVAERVIGQLSRGFRQRTGIAQAILHRPPVVILDEPTAGLDPLQIREIRDLIRGLGRDRAVILSSHILPEVQGTCSRVLILHQGRIVHGEALAADGDAARLEQTFIDVVTGDAAAGVQP